MTAPHPSTDEVLRQSVDPDAGAARGVTLDPRFQGLPDTAHGGTILALFDAVAGGTGARTVAGTYRRRVPLGSPLTLSVTHDGATTQLRLADGATLLVDGTVGALDAAAPSAPPPPVVATPPPGAIPREMALPVSKTCFACGTENALGLRVQLAIDDEHVYGAWTPHEMFRARGPNGASDHQLAPVAITTLLDEAAFWLGAAASGESGMTTELRVTLHAPVAAGSRILVGGERGTVRARAGDPRYWDTAVGAWDENGRLVARAAITFVAVRGAARKLVAGLLAVNPPDVMRRVFPAYVA